MNGTKYAKRIFVHYITMLMETAGLYVDGDTRAEIETAVDNIMMAAVEQAKREILAELATAGENEQ